MGTRQVRWALSLAAAIAMVPAPALAQGAGTATVTGQVRDVTTSAPVPGATVAIPALRRTVTADSLGEFRIERLPAGAHRWVIVALGYVGLNEEMVVADGDRFTIGIMPSPVPVEGVTVNAQTVERYFARRARAAGASIILLRGEDLTRGGAPNVESLMMSRANIRPCVLGEMGYRVITTVAVAEIMCVQRRGRWQPVGAIYLDGRPAMGGFLELATIPPSAVYAIEVAEGGRRINVYTARFAERLARGRESIPASSPVN